ILALAGNALAQEPDEPSPSPEAWPSPSPSPLPVVVAPVILTSVAPPPFAVTAAEEGRTLTWPWALDVHVLVGAELHSIGQPTAFGLGAEALYHGWLGLFVSLLGSE